MGKFKMVNRQGGSRVIALTEAIPPDWIAVNVDVVKRSENSVTIKLEKVQ